MKYANLYQLLSLKNAVVTFTDELDKVETDFNKGMRCRVVGSDVDDEIPFFIVDATEYRDHNMSVASSDYYDRDGKPTLTAFEKGMYRDIDSIFPNMDDGLMVTPDDPELAAICNFVVENNLGDVPLPVVLMHLASDGKYSMDRGIDAPYDTGSVIVTTDNMFNPFNNRTLPVFTIAMVNGDEEDGYFLSAILSPLDRNAQEWNRSISMKIANDIYKPWKFMSELSAEKALESYNFYFDTPNIPASIPYDSQVRGILEQNPDFGSLVSRAAKADMKELSRKPKSQSISFSM